MLDVLGAVGMSAPGAISVAVTSLKAEYAGCGSHELEVELSFAGESGVKQLAKQLRDEADRLDPPTGIPMGPTFAEIHQDRADLIEASRAVIGYRNGHTEYLLSAAIDNLYNIMKRLGAYE